MISSNLTKQPSTCKICRQTFENEAELVTHEVTKHPNVGNTNHTPPNQAPSKVEPKKNGRAA